MIHVEDLSYAYPDSESLALKEITFQVEAGSLLAIIGPNQAGKSTLGYCLSGFIPHFFKGKPEGHVLVAEMNVFSTPLSELAGEIGLVFQNPFNQISGARFTVREEVAFGLENLGVPRAEMDLLVEQALETTGLTDLAHRSPFTLSGGEQQRLAIASMIVMRPQVLVLDEPTSQLDPLGTRQVFSSLRALAKSHETTIVLIDNKLEWIAHFADEVVVLDQGQIVAQGNPKTVLAQPLIEQCGVEPTRYTQAAWAAKSQGLIAKEGDIPVTLQGAVDFFR